MVLGESWKCPYVYTGLLKSVQRTGKICVPSQLFFNNLKVNIFVTVRPTLLKTEQKIMKSLVIALEKVEFTALLFGTSEAFMIWSQGYHFSIISTEKQSQGVEH